MEIPPHIADFNKCKPVYKVFKGWRADISKVKKYKDLPSLAKKYVAFVEKQLKTPVAILSVGPSRGEEIFL